MNKEFWNDFWSKRILEYKTNYSPPAFELWGKYLKTDQNLTCMELGCVPGRVLIFLQKKFGYSLIGIDYSDKIEIVENNFRLNNVNNFKLYKDDFLNVSTDIKTDVVVSLGFVEHFKNYKDIISKHAHHLKENGTLVIVIPNLRYLQFLLHSIFDKKILKEHVLGAMHPNLLKRILKENNLQVKECCYFQTFDFWVEASPSTKFKSMFRRFILNFAWEIKHILKKFYLDNIPNKYLSPWIVCVAKKET